MTYRVALVKWADHDGIAEAICNELVELGHQVTYFRFDEALPSGVDVVFSFAPYGRFWQIPRQLGRIPPEQRPTLVHWNTENPPDLRLPWFIMKPVSDGRAWLDRLNDSNNPRLRAWVARPPLVWVNRRMHKFRYVGEYHYAYRRGWLDILAESSEIYAHLHRRHGLPAIVAPWGTVPHWHAMLNLDRDIEVLWMGIRRTPRRSQLLDQVRAQLAAQGVSMYVADNIEHPFIHGEVRTQFLNRAKITLNLLPLWYDNAFPYRFHMAAGNRSLVVSEPILPHCPLYEAGRHYVSAPVEALAETIVYYLNHEDERRQIADNAYELVTTQMTFGNSVKTIMKAVDKTRS